MVCSICLTSVILFLGIVGFLAFKKFGNSSKKIPEVREKQSRKDFVFLYQFPRTKKCPNLSPFCLKLETFFRIYEIPYEVVPVMKERSKNGQLPYIEFNGEHIADSDLIIHRLKKHFNIVEDHDEQVVALSTFADHHLFYVLIRYKMCDHFYKVIREMAGIPEYLEPIVLPLIAFFFGRKTYQRSVAAIGDFDESELKEILKRDLEVIKKSIKGKFLFGDKLTSADAAIFGQIASVYYPSRNSLTHMFNKDYPMILDYVERIKRQLYPTDFSI